MNTLSKILLKKRLLEHRQVEQDIVSKIIHDSVSEYLNNESAVIEIEIENSLEEIEKYSAKNFNKRRSYRGFGKAYINQYLKNPNDFKKEDLNSIISKIVRSTNGSEKFKVEIASDCRTNGNSSFIPIYFRDENDMINHVSNLIKKEVTYSFSLK